MAGAIIRSALKRIPPTTTSAHGIQIRFGGVRLPDNAEADLMNHCVEMDECITVRVPRGISLALERAEIGAHSRPGQIARRMLLDGLRASGLELASSVEPDAQSYRFR